MLIVSALALGLGTYFKELTSSGIDPDNALVAITRNETIWERLPDSFQLVALCDMLRAFPHRRVPFRKAQLCCWLRKRALDYDYYMHREEEDAISSHGDGQSEGAGLNERLRNEAAPSL